MEYSEYTVERIKIKKCEIHCYQVISQMVGTCHSGTGKKDAILHFYMGDFYLCKLGHLF